MWRTRRGYDDQRIEAGSIAAALFALALIASLFWMGVTGNRFCCDQKSLLGQLRKQLFAAASFHRSNAELAATSSPVLQLQHGSRQS